MKNYYLPLTLSLACIAMAPALVQAQESRSGKGVIYAKPQDISSYIPLEKVLAISAFFQNPENMVKIQFPTNETKFA